jgi:hypothetical protein
MRTSEPPAELLHRLTIVFNAALAKVIKQNKLTISKSVNFPGAAAVRAPKTWR